MIIILSAILLFGRAASPEPASRAADVELIAAWVLGRNTGGAFESEFGDARWLTDAEDVIVYTDMAGVRFPEGLRAVPYDFAQARMDEIHRGGKVEPAVVITGSWLADPPEEGPRAQKYRDLEPGERCYHVEVGIGNMAWHWFKITIRDVKGKPKVEIHSRKVS
jgi:hypothetical protein